MTIDRKALIKKYGNEQVFVVPFSSTQKIPDKFSIFKDNLLDMRSGRYIHRYCAEGNVSMQQIIPCIVIYDENNNYLTTKRLAGDERLRDKLSIIIGGHMNPVDGYGSESIQNCLLRELGEETNLLDICNETPLSIKEIAKTIAYIRDLKSTTPDHVGIVYFLKISNNTKKKLKIKETDTLKAQWMTPDELGDNYISFESWGQMIIAEILFPDV